MADLEMDLGGSPDDEAQGDLLQFDPFIVVGITVFRQNGIEFGETDHLTRAWSFGAR